jgi:3-hydroxyacyl-CoA dehydrogenase
MEEIVVKIGKDGSVVIDTNGFTGNACKEATRKLEEALGIVEEEHLKPEYYLQAEQDNSLFLGGGS